MGFNSGFKGLILSDCLISIPSVKRIAAVSAL